MNKRETVASNSGSGSLPYWTGPTCNNNTSAVKTDLSQRSYYFVKIANDKDIDYRSMSESAKKNYLSHEVEEEEEDEEDTDTAPILANTRVITSNRFNKKNSSKPRTNIKKHKNTSCSNIGCESTSLIVDQISNPRTNTAFLRNNNCNTSKNTCMIGRCASGEPGHCDGFHNNCLHLPPPLINNPYPSDPHCCLEESNSSIPAEVFATKVCFVKKGQVVSTQGPTPNLNVAAAGNYQAGEENLQLNGSASSSLLNPVPSFSSLPKSSLFSPATTTNSASAVITLSSNVEDIVAVREGEFSNGLEGGGISLPPLGGRRGRSTTTCSSFASLSSASGAGCSATSSSSLPAWSSPHAMGEHCHPAQASNNQVDKLARNQLIAVSALCCIFMTCEIVGGILSNSLALFTDVLHLGSDLISFSIGLLALYLSIKPATESMSFGYHRIEVLGAVISVLLIWVVSGILCYIATERIITENYKNVYADEMLLTASLGVLFNIIMGFVLHSNFCCKSDVVKNHGHSHSHIHNGHSGANSQQMYHRLSQEPTENTPAIMECHPLSKPKQNVNIRAAIIHVIGDIIQSTGVLVAALIIKFTEKEEYKLADPICTFIFSIIVLCTTFNVLRDTIFVVMEGVPHDISYKKIRSELETLDHVKMVHNLCVWSLTLNKNAVSVHLALDEVADTQIILEGATAMLRQRYNFQFITIQVERYLPTMSQCPECLTPS